MKLSNDTVNVLKNFAGINTGIVINEGNVIKTVSSHKNILAQATVAESFPNQFGVYDLNNFLTVLGLHKDEPDIEFGEKSATIAGMGGRSKVNYRFCDPIMVVTPSDKPINMPDAEIRFSLNEDDLTWILRTAAVLGSPNVAVVSDGSKISVLVFDASNDSASTNTLDVGDGNGDSYKMIFKTESLKMIPGSYDVEISSRGISHFTNRARDLQYWITTETGSTYSKA